VLYIIVFEFQNDFLMKEDYLNGIKASVGKTENALINMR
jgi:hypothetical protein